MGSVIVEHLVRNGVGSIEVIDKDFMEPGNVSRHACTTVEAGLPKAAAIQLLAHRINPFLHVTSRQFPIGAAVPGLEAHKVLVAGIEASDLVVDASAQFSVQRVTSDFARRSGTHWIGVHATNGAWDGVVLTIPGDAHWCYVCHKRELGSGRIQMPEEDSTPPHQPIRCAEPTFTGSSVDLTETSIHGARTALAVLSGEVRTGLDLVFLRRDGKGSWYLSGVGAGR